MDTRSMLDSMFAGLSTQQMLDMGMSAEDLNIAKSLQEMRNKALGSRKDSQGLSRTSKSSPGRQTSPSVRSFTGSPMRNVNKIMNDVEEDKPVNISKPTSYRFYDPSPDGSFLSMDEYSGSRRKAIPSTCVKSIRYYPSKSRCEVVFVGGTKSYTFKVPPESFEEFLEATSKGRHVNWVLKKYFRAPESMWKS